MDSLWLNLGCYAAGLLMGFVAGRVRRRAHLRDLVEQEKKKYTEEVRTRLKSALRLFE